MKYLLSLKILKFIYKNYLYFLEDESLWNFSAREIIYNFHLCFLIHYPVFILLSPYFWYSLIFRQMQNLINYVYSLIFLIFYLLFVIFLDKIHIYSQAPRVNFQRPHFYLLVSVEVSSMIFFNLIHPLFALLVFFIGMFHSLIVGSILWSKYLNKKFYNIILQILVGVSLILVCILFLIILLNLFLSYKTLKQFGIL